MMGDPFMGTETAGETDDGEPLIKCESPEIEMIDVSSPGPALPTDAFPGRTDHLAADTSPTCLLVGDVPVDRSVAAASVHDSFYVAKMRALTCIEQPDHWKLVECIASNNRLIAAAGLYHQDFGKDEYDIKGCTLLARTSANQILAARQYCFGLSDSAQGTAFFEGVFHRQQCVRVWKNHFHVPPPPPGLTERFCLTPPLPDIEDDQVYSALSVPKAIREQARSLERFCEIQDALCHQSLSQDIDDYSSTTAAARSAFRDIVNNVRDSTKSYNASRVAHASHKLEDLLIAWHPDDFSSQEGIGTCEDIHGVPKELAQRVRAAAALVNSVQTHTFSLTRHTKGEKRSVSYDAAHPPSLDTLYTQAEGVMQYAWRSYHTAVHKTGF